MPDNLTPSQRSFCMSRVRSRDTSLERRIRSELHLRGLRFRKYDRKLPGTPDVVFASARVAVFIDGDFWHGFHFSKWKHTLSDSWAEKIQTNIARDKKAWSGLKKMGWCVVRIWEHEIKQDVLSCVCRIEAAVNDRRSQHARNRM